MAAPGPTAKPSICAPTRLRLVVSGPSRNGADISRISLGLVDAHGEKFEFRPAESIRSGESEWTLVYEILERGWVDGFKGMTPKKGFTSGTNRNDTLDFPLKLEILYVRLKDGFTKGDATFVHLSDEADAHPAARLQCVASSGADSARCAMLPGPKPAFGARNASRAGAVKVSVDTGSPMCLLKHGSNNVPRLILRNSSIDPVEVRGVARVRDFRGKGRDVPICESLLPGGAGEVPLGMDFDKGMWRVICDWSADDGSAAWDALRFAVMDFAAVTPRWPRGRHFRAGVCYHPIYLSDGDFELALEALSKAGVKLVRINGFAFSLCEPSPGVFDWTRADRLQDAHESRGMSISAGFYRVPQWAAVDGASEKLRNAEQRPSRPGLLQDYARALAARYGGKIDYYELGNEWDMVPPEVLPEDEAVRLHREAYAGLKEGCSAAKLISNGWASDMVFAGRHVRVGFQGRYMAQVKDICDFHAFHLHGPFAGYEKSVDRQIARRRELGLDMPWFSNETAISSVGGGESVVALDVWKKILYAWSQGSVDYIWYNLFAAGWMPCDEEQGYGLMTADARPRAGYVALAGFINTLQGLDFDSTVCKSGGTYLFRFGGSTESFSGVALAGWCAESRPLRVKTDAKAAFSVDLFGNRRPLAIADGGIVEWTFSEEPGALLLVGASTAELVKSSNE